MSKRDALLSAIEERPGDDDLRRVYADLLIEEGDPRGEFVALQLLERPNDEQRARIDALLSAHRTAWLGELAPALDETESRFARGFLSSVRFHGWHVLDPKIAQDRAFATVETIDPWWTGGWTDEIAFEILANPRWKALEEAYRIPFPAFDRIFGGEGTCRARAISVAGLLDVRRAAAATADPRGFPRLTSLRWIDVPNRNDGPSRNEPAFFADVFAAVPRALEHFGIWSHGVLSLGAWMRAIETVPFTTMELGWPDGRILFTLRRASPSDRFEELEVTMPSKWPRIAKLMDIVRLALESVPPPALGAFSIKTTDGGKLAPTNKRQLAETLKRFPRLQK